MTVNNSGRFDVDVSGSASYGFTLYENAAHSASYSSAVVIAGDQSGFSLKGFARTRCTTLTAAISAGATSASVLDATGWQVGDKIIFATTSAWNTTTHTDTVTLTSVSGGNIGWSGGITYEHANLGYVGNFTSNLNIQPDTSGDMAGLWWQRAYSVLFINKLLSHVAFNNCTSMNYNASGAFSVGNPNGPAGTTTSDLLCEVSDCVFYQFKYSAIQLNSISNPVVQINNIVYSDVITGKGNSETSDGVLLISSTNAGDIVNPGIFRATGSVTKVGLSHASNGSNVVGGFISGCNWVGLSTASISSDFDGCEVFSNAAGLYSASTSTTFKNLKLGTHNGGAATNNVCDSYRYKNAINITFTDSDTEALDLTGFSSAIDTSKLQWINKQNDVTQQEIYRPFVEIKRNNSTFKRSASSISIKPTRAGIDGTKTLSIPVATGGTVRVIGYCQFDTNFYNSNDYNAPTVTVSGLGITPVVYTATSAANGAWEQFDLSATNSGGNAGNFTLTYTANAKTVTTGAVYFDGVPDAPFITNCRHYGFLFDETNPARVVNSTTSANEATAAAYTGMTVSWGATSHVTAFGADQTFQKLYDYTQAQACLNLAHELPLTGSGTAGSPSLTALGNITITTGYKLNGAGSINMGSKTLTSELTGAIAYTYTGGIWSQLTTVPSFNGGQLNIGAAGTFTFAGSGDGIVSMTPTAPGTYNLSASTFSGTVDLRNTAAHAITVQMPSGAAYTTANNVGGAITVTSAGATITFTGLPTGTDIVILTAGTSTILDQVDANAGTSYAWGYSGAPTVDVGFIKPGYVPLYIRGMALSGTDASLPVSLTTDRNYQ